MKKFAVLLIILVAAIAAVNAQFNPNDPYPLDTSIRIGRLPNGLAYYIWHNEKPKNRCEFRLANDVGAIVERDDENGLAHFLEHMQFNSTLHFEGRSIIEYFESVGVSYGGGVNAYTALDKTVYWLLNVPTTRQGILDTALLVMYDWSCGALLKDEEIEKERGIIVEEWRTNQTADIRMSDRVQQMIMASSQYAKRDVLGDTNVIKNFKPQTLRDFYHRWYGPDLQALIVVGDINVDSMEQKIIAMFSDIKPREGLTPRPRYGAIDNDKPLTGIYLDPEAQYERITIGFKHPHPTKEQAASYGAYLWRSKVSFIIECLSTRLKEKYGVDQLFSYYARMQCGYFNLYGETDAFQIHVDIDNGKEQQMYRALCEEVERIRRYGILQEELDIVLKNELVSLERNLKMHVNRESKLRAENLVYQFMTNRGMTTPQFKLDFYKRYLANLTAEELNAMIPELFNENDRNMYIVAVGKAAPNENGMGCSECNMPTEEELLTIYNEVRNSKIDSPIFKKNECKLVSKEPNVGKIVSIKQNEDIEATEITLSNNVKVVVKRTENSIGNIILNAVSDGGYSLYPPKDILNAKYACKIVERSGVGNMTPMEQQKALAGKSVMMSAGLIISVGEKLSGSCTTKDFETLLQILYLTFTAPRSDEKEFSKIIEQKRSDLTSDMSWPGNDFYRQLGEVKYGHSDRYIYEDTSTLKMIDRKRALQIYKERFGNPADFKFYVIGDININDSATLEHIAKWIGGLRTTKKFDSIPANPDYDVTNGTHFVYCKHTMETKTATSQITITGHGFDYSLENIIKVDLMSNILSTRLFEAIREGESGTYGVDVLGWLAKYNTPHVNLSIDFDTDPERQYLLINKIYDEIEKIIAEGPLATDLAKQKEIMLNKFEEDSQDNYEIRSRLENYYENGFNYERDYVKIVESITGEDIRQMLKTIYDQKNIIEAALLPTR